MAAQSPFNQFWSRMGDSADEEFTDDEDISPLNQGKKSQAGQNGEGEKKAWDSFRKLPPPTGSLSEETVPWMDRAIEFIKITTYIITFVVVLLGSFFAKAVLLLMTSQLRTNNIVSVCPERYNFLNSNKQYVTTIPDSEGVAWGWAIFFCFLGPEVGTMLRSIRMLLFKSVVKGKFIDFVVVTVCETIHVFGVVVLLYVVLPDLDVVRGAMLTNCFCFMPGFLGLLSRNKVELHFNMKLSIDAVALFFQIVSFIAWPVLEYTKNPDSWQVWMIPVGTFCTSFGWWENYVDKDSPFRIIQELAKIKKRLWRSRYFVYLIVSIWKCCVYFGFMILALYMRYEDISTVFDLSTAFSSHSITIYESKESIYSSSEISESQNVFEVKSNAKSSVYAFLLLSLMSYLCYIFAKFACKISIQGFSFAFPLSLAVPFTVLMLVTGCGAKYSNPCAFGSMPFYLFWECDEEHLFYNFFKDEYAWLWLFWLISQNWITLHIWNPKCERLVSTERLFVTPMYNALFVDQSIALNRRRDDDVNPSDLFEYEAAEEEDDEFYEESKLTSNLYKPKVKSRASDNVTRVYVCATMWHENREEMMEFLKSILRMDEDQSARRITQQYFEVIDPDYYEFETHIYFDDAFEISDEDENEHEVNSFVKLLVSLIEDAACHVHQSEVRIRPPKKYPTPYGGRLVWILPGKTRIICHLKDKDKIRHKKRWSQVMYMYYLLGFKLMEQPIAIERKEVIAENTYLLALDGDIDFTPKAVTLLVDLMKKNKNLGAACGRIHPVGTGVMVWYQMFEYAVGHWLQKATEHVLGCVLCSPGCFALFRGKALMDDNVMARYTTISTQARHYVQFDQGEDRWLCTLILQRGYRVEYSAASDAYTHAPEGFGEFYNQRRRWVPSTMANIMDLLQDYKQTVKVNDNISLLYIMYQAGLMLGTIVGPGMIFLVIEGSFVSAFGIDQLTAFWVNLVPLIIFMVICFTMESKYQIGMAYFLTAIYALVMVIVMIGMFINFADEGFLNPTAIFFFGTVFIFIITGLLHPQEIICLPMGIIYYLVVPSMYMLLMIYSVFNLNNVSWGTREVATKKTKEEQEAEKKALEAAQKQQKAEGLMGLLYRNKSNDKKGSVEFSCAGLFKIMCCVQPKVDESVQIRNNLDELRRKLDSLVMTINQGSSGGGQRRSTVAPRKSLHHKKSLAGPAALPVLDFDQESSDDPSEDSGPKEERDDLVNPFWMEDKDLLRGEVDYLPSVEIQFFKDLIEIYLKPLIKNPETQKKIANDLKELRNIVVFSFLMLNSIFVLVMFILDLNKDSIHVNWPLGQSVNISYNPDVPEVLIEKDYLQLAPIGLMFVVFFGCILLIQFFAMFVHRFGTLSHILASTPLKLCNRKPKDMTDEGELEQNALAIVKDWQRPEAMREGGKSFAEPPAGRRATLHTIEQHRVQKPVTTTLDAVFKDRYARFTSVAVPNADNEVKVGGRRLTIRRDTINAMVDRRKSVVERRKSMAAERRATIYQANAMLEAEDEDTW